MNNTAVIFLLLIALGLILAITTPRGRDVVDVAIGRARAVRS